MSKTAHIAEGMYTFKMTNTYGGRRGLLSRDVFRESFDVAGRITMTNGIRQAASGFDEVHRVSLFVVAVPDDENQLVSLDSVGHGNCCG